MGDLYEGEYPTDMTVDEARLELEARRIINDQEILLDRYELGRMQGLHEAKVACDGYSLELDRRTENVHHIHKHAVLERKVGADICAVLIEGIIRQSHMGP